MHFPWFLTTPTGLPIGGFINYLALYPLLCPIHNVILNNLGEDISVCVCVCGGVCVGVYVCFLKLNLI